MSVASKIRLNSPHLLMKIIRKLLLCLRKKKLDLMNLPILPVGQAVCCNPVYNPKTIYSKTNYNVHIPKYFLNNIKKHNFLRSTDLLQKTMQC